MISIFLSEFSSPLLLHLKSLFHLLKIQIQDLLEFFLWLYSKHSTQKLHRYHLSYTLSKPELQVLAMFISNFQDSSLGWLTLSSISWVNHTLKILSKLYIILYLGVQTPTPKWQGRDFFSLKVKRLNSLHHWEVTNPIRDGFSNLLYSRPSLMVNKQNPST